MTWWERLLNLASPVFAAIYFVAFVGGIGGIWIACIYLTFASGTALGLRVLTAAGTLVGAAVLALIAKGFVDVRKRRESELQVLKERADAFEAFYYLTIADDKDVSPEHAEAVMDRIDRIIRSE